MTLMLLGSQRSWQTSTRPARWVSLRGRDPQAAQVCQAALTDLSKKASGKTWALPAHSCPGPCPAQVEVTPHPRELWGVLFGGGTHGNCHRCEVLPASQGNKSACQFPMHAVMGDPRPLGQGHRWFLTDGRGNSQTASWVVPVSRFPMG